MSWAESAKSLSSKTIVEDCVGISGVVLGVDVQIQGRGHWLVSGGEGSPDPGGIWGWRAGASAQFRNWTTWSDGCSMSPEGSIMGLSKAPSGWKFGAALISLLPSDGHKLGSSPPQVQVDGCRVSPRQWEY